MEGGQLLFGTVGLVIEGDCMRPGWLWVTMHASVYDVLDVGTAVVQRVEAMNSGRKDSDGKSTMQHNGIGATWVNLNWVIVGGANEIGGPTRRCFFCKVIAH